MHENTQSGISSKIKIIQQKDLPLANNFNFVNSLSSIQYFHQHKVLNNFLPPHQKISFSHIFIAINEELNIEHEQNKKLIIILKGEAVLNNKRTVQAGDILLMPELGSLKLKATSENGLFAIEIKLNPCRLETKPTLSYEPNYEALLEHNKIRTEKFIQNPFFIMLGDSTLENKKKREVFLNCVQVFSDFFQIMLFSRQATCINKKYQNIFNKHLQEEYGHDELLAAREDKAIIKDPILIATCSWFSHQMFVLDNVEKAALVHLVLEISGYYYHTLAQKVLQNYLNSNYYPVHTENDENHAAIGMELLQGHCANTYESLHKVIDEGWDMLEAMTGRVTEIVNSTNN